LSIFFSTPTLDSPEDIATDPYGEGWLLKVRISNDEDLAEAMSAAEYQALVEGEV
jgi:glycine cleavage system H protein